MGARRAPCCRPHLLGLCSLPRRLAPLQPVSFTHPEEVGKVPPLFGASPDPPGRPCPERSPTLPWDAFPAPVLTHAVAQA